MMHLHTIYPFLLTILALFALTALVKQINYIFHYSTRLQVIAFEARKKPEGYSL